MPIRELHHPDWVRRLNYFGPAAGGAHRLVSLDPDELLATARAATGLDDLGEADWPGWEETYRRFVASADAEADLHLLGRVVTRAELLRILQTWLRLQEAWARQPEIRAAPVEAPVFVVGPPRTGTSILLELLALDPGLRAPLAWEALHPLPRPDVPIERRVLAECEQEFWADIHPEFMTMHELASDLPCECVHFLAYDFAGPYWGMLYDTPSFTGWQLENLDALGRVYRLHRAMLQTFQHGDPPRRWLLKSPAHVSTLPQLFAEYPDALVVHTHRDPARFIASLVSILSTLRFMRSDSVDVAALGTTMLATYQMFLESAIDQRVGGVVPDDRIADSHFLDLMRDPVGTVRSIYDRFGLPWPAGHDAAIRGYLEAKPKGKFGEHRYTFEEFGLDEDAVRAAFERYRTHYGIEEERGG